MIKSNLLIAVILLGRIFPSWRCSLFIPNFDPMKNLFLLLLIGHFTSFTLMSQNEFNQVDENGLKQGAWKKYHRGDSVVKYEGSFIDDKAVGLFTHNYSNGAVRVKIVHGPGLVSRAVNYWPDGSVMGKGKYVREQKDSTWLYFDQFSTKIAEEYYIEGKKYGNWKVYYPSGTLMEERIFENDMENGLFKQYYENGKLYREATFVNGGQEGKVTFYHENGQIDAQGMYHKDVKEGLWKTFDDKGELMMERMYVKGLPTDSDRDIILEDSNNYYKKDRFTIEDVHGEDNLEIPDKKEEKRAKKSRE